jgi:hypothetical protein
MSAQHLPHEAGRTAEEEDRGDDTRAEADTGVDEEVRKLWSADKLHCTAEGR